MVPDVFTTEPSDMAYPRNRHAAPLRHFRRSSRATLLALAAGMFLLPADVLAYIDPATGSLLYQTILAVLLGAGVVFRRVWLGIGKTLLSLIGRRSNGDSTDAPGAP